MPPGAYTIKVKHFKGDPLLGGLPTNNRLGCKILPGKALTYWAYL
jgi:hypothetical protein